MRNTLVASAFTMLSIATASAQLTIPKEYLPEVHGTIRRVFEGRLRLRRRPSFEDDAICGVTLFDEKKVEKKAKIGDRVLYKTTDGYWISGDPEHTEFIPEE